MGGTGWPKGTDRNKEAGSMGVAERVAGETGKRKTEKKC